MVLHYFGVASRRDPRGLVQILQSDRDTVQWPAVMAGGYLGLGGAGLGECLLCQNADETVEAAVKPRDAVDPALYQFNRR